MVDPRISVIDERLKDVKRIIAVSSGKGGVGKSLTASALSLALVRKDFRVGLLDLDFTSPSTHIILGIGDVKPKEEKGVIPTYFDGLEYMSIIYYSGSSPTPLRGADVTNVLIELLSVTKWGRLDFLLLDMPPGIGDVTLDLIRLIPRTEFMIVATPSKLAFETVRRLARLLKDVNVPLVGVVKNMKMNETDDLGQKLKNLNLRLIGEVNYDSFVEDVIGDRERLMSTNFGKQIQEIAEKI
jgi:ATP-binding protein involved in chromosome partitioning